MKRGTALFASLALSVFLCSHSIAKSNDSQFAPTLKTTLAGHQSQVYYVVFSSGGELVATADRDTTKVWTTSGKLLWTVDGTAPVFSPDGHVLLTTNNKKAKLWEAVTGQLKLTLTGYEAGISSTAFSPDGSRIATACEAGSVKIWDATTGLASITLWPVKKLPRYKLISRLNRWAKFVGVEFSPDLKYVLTRMRDKSKLSEIATGRLLEEFDQFVTVATFSPDSKWLGINGRSDHAALLNLETGQMALPSSGETHFLNQLVFSPDGRTYVTGSGYKDYHATIVEVSTGRIMRTIPLAARWGSDIISVYLKDADTLSFHPSSKFLMGANQKSVRLWDASSGQLVWENAEARVPAAFSRDGKWLVTVGRDKKTVLLWEAEK